ncbi:ENV1 protein, partial [Xiphorhynchus elegans]|nr:ENV1 protein [Xiphorhynchus elegans]
MSIGSNSLLSLLDTSHQVLNQTYPNYTKHCWLCFNAKPPYYEAIGISDHPKSIDGSNPPQCRWENGTRSVSLQQVTGKGSCIG